MTTGRIVFRADASKNIGFGHFFRSLALCGYLKADFDCHFATYNNCTPNHLPTDYELKQIVKKATPLPLDATTFDSFNEDFLDNAGANDIVVLDNYYFDTEYQRRIKNKGCKLVCIDDIHDRHMVCDLLLTPSPLKRDDFSLEDYTKFAGGIEWAFLREPFLTPVPARNISTDIKKIVLAMGGADAFNLTDKIAEIVHEALPETLIELICGETACVSRNTMQFANVNRCISAEEIVDLFDKSDIGIFPASTICIEAFSRKLPVIAGYYTDNQMEFYQYGVYNSLFSPLGNLLDNSDKIQERLSRILPENRPHSVVMDFNCRKNKIINLFKNL